MINMIINNNKPKVYHLFNTDTNDTACKMWSTGGFKKGVFSAVESHRGLPLCNMCGRNAQKEVYTWILS